MTSSMPIIVTHTCALFRDGLRQIFARSRFRPIQVHATLTEEAESYMRSASNCLWLAGVSECVCTTSDRVKRVVSANPQTKVVILASAYTPAEIVSALESGAQGFLPQDIPSDQLIKSLELIALGDTAIHPPFHQKSWIQTVVPEAVVQQGSDQVSNDNFATERDTNPPTARSNAPLESRLSNMVTSGESDGQSALGLSRRELLILRSLIEGESNKVIARRLVITEATVKVHMKAILRKLRLKNRTQAAIWARNYFNEPGSLELACTRFS